MYLHRGICATRIHITCFRISRYTTQLTPAAKMYITHAIATYMCVSSALLSHVDPHSYIIIAGICALTSCALTWPPSNRIYWKLNELVLTSLYSTTFDGARAMRRLYDFVKLIWSDMVCPRWYPFIERLAKLKKNRFYRNDKCPKEKCSI